MTTGNQSSSQQSSPGQTGGNQSPPHNIGGSIPTIPTVTITYVAPTVPTVQKVSTGIPYQWVTPGTVVNTAYLWNNPAVVGDLEFWVESQRAKLSDDERARLDSIDETMKALEDPAWYFWPTWDQALQCGRHGTEQELRRLIPTLMWTNQQPMNEIYTPIAQILQDTIKKNFPLEGNYWVAFKDRPLDNLSFIENLSIHKIVYLVGEKGGGMDFDCKRWPKRGNSYRHIMFPINKYLWIKKLRHFFKDLNLPPPHGPVLNPDPFRAFMCRGYFNSFVKPVVECQPSVGKAYKITISIPILNVTLGSKLIPRKTAERVLRHHPSFLRAPGYEYAETYIDQDGKEQPKPGVWIYGSALDDPSIGFSGDYDGSNFGTPPTVFTGRTLFEYHHPKMDALILDLRQTMRRGNRGHYDDDEFLVVEQLWAVIIPTKETLITFQSMKPAVIPGQVGGFNNYMFEPTKGMDVTPQGPVHGFFIYFADFVLLQHYHILEAFKEGTAALNFRVAHKPIADEELVADCNAVISEVAIILEITRKQMEILSMIKEAAMDNTLRPEELSAANEFYKYMMGRFEIVAATFEEIRAEAKQAQDLLFQLLNIEASKKQVAMAIQQEIIAKQTAEETAVQLELAKQSAEQSEFQLELAKQSTEQNKSFLVFTIITTIFLPLSFFTSYFGMNTADIRDMEWDQRYFWKTAGPSSAMIILVVMCWAFRAQMKRGVGIVFQSKSKLVQIDEECAIGSPEKGGQVPGKRGKGSWNPFGRGVDKND